MSASFDSVGRPGYVYNKDTDTWHQISGHADTSSTYEWGGDHSFLSSVFMLYTFVSQHGINNFLNPAARNSAIASPINGTICIIRQDEHGNIVNQLQIYDGSDWVSLAKGNQIDSFYIEALMGAI